MSTALVLRLREQLTVHLPADIDLTTAAQIRRMMVERAEAADELERMQTFVDQIAEQVVGILEEASPNKVRPSLQPAGLAVPTRPLDAADPEPGGSADTDGPG